MIKKINLIYKLYEPNLKQYDLIKGKMQFYRNGFYWNLDIFTYKKNEYNIPELH